jgi:hypothetical protein
VVITPGPLDDDELAEALRAARSWRSLLVNFVLALASSAGKSSFGAGAGGDADDADVGAGTFHALEGAARGGTLTGAGGWAGIGADGSFHGLVGAGRGAALAGPGARGGDSGVDPRLALAGEVVLDPPGLAGALPGPGPDGSGRFGALILRPFVLASGCLPRDAGGYSLFIRKVLICLPMVVLLSVVPL